MHVHTHTYIILLQAWHMYRPLCIYMHVYAQCVRFVLFFGVFFVYLPFFLFATFSLISFVSWFRFSHTFRSFLMLFRTLTRHLFPPLSSSLYWFRSLSIFLFLSLCLSESSCIFLSLSLFTLFSFFLPLPLIVHIYMFI